MTTMHHPAALRHRTAGVAARSRSLLALVVQDDAGADIEVVSPFGSETAARQWADGEGITAFRLLPARVAGGRR